MPVSDTLIFNPLLPNNVVAYKVVREGSMAASVKAMTAVLLCVLVLVGGCSAQLSPGFYSKSCPKLFQTVNSVVQSAIQKEARMGASLLRLFFHDCFVNGCDGSVLLDDTSSFTGEKRAEPNFQSARGFEVIDQIKSDVEKVCPGVVSCADILAIASRDSTVTARCTSFRARIYNESNIDSSFAQSRKGNCPRASGSGDNNLAPLDLQTPIKFDNNYYVNLVNKKGLLHSDQQLFNGVSTDSIVRGYSTNPAKFRSDFAAAMIKMGDIKPLTGNNGEIRKNCRRRN
nr:Peroxidase 67 [Ipomoea batatas]